MSSLSPPRRGEGRRALLALTVVLAATAFAHPSGFHKKLTFTLTKTTVTGLVVMDVDSGERCRLLREASDEDRNGLLEGDEVAALKKRLVAMATRNLKLGLSGAPLPVEVKETKLSLREDKRANDSPLSVAVLIELKHPHEVSEGMQFEVEDTAPDLSTIVVQVVQESAEPPLQVELESGKKTKVRLGKLGGP